LISSGSLTTSFSRSLATVWYDLFPSISRRTHCWFSFPTSSASSPRFECGSAAFLYPVGMCRSGCDPRHQERKTKHISDDAEGPRVAPSRKAKTAGCASSGTALQILPWERRDEATSWQAPSDALQSAERTHARHDMTRSSPFSTLAHVRYTTIRAYTPSKHCVLTVLTEA
jgi:hypothetical protein